MGEKTTHFLLGALVGGVAIAVYFGGRNKLKLNAMKKTMETDKQTANDAGYEEAHQNFDQLLTWAQQNGFSPAYIQKVIRGEVQ